MIASLRLLHIAKARKLLRPAVSQHFQKVYRHLPVIGEFFGHERGELRKVGAFRYHHVEEAGEITRKAERAHIILAALFHDKAGKAELAFKRGHGRRESERLFPKARRIENEFFLIHIAKRANGGQDQRLPAARAQKG